MSLHFWNWEVLKKAGDNCKGFVVVDDDTSNFPQLQWARLLVRSEGKDQPGTLQLVGGSNCFAIQLCWEMPPWVSMVVSMHGKNERPKVREEGRVDTHAGRCMGFSQAQEHIAGDGVACSNGEVIEREVVVDSDLHGLGIVGGARQVAGKGGRGKAVVKERNSLAVVGVRLSGEGSGPKDNWAEVGKKRCGLVYRAHEPQSRGPYKSGPMAQSRFRVDLNLVEKWAGGPIAWIEWSFLNW